MIKTYILSNISRIIHSKSAAAFVIRDHNGRLIKAGGRILNESSVPQAELTAARLDMLVAVHESHAQRLWLEGDSLTVIKWISKPSTARLFRSPLLGDINLWKSSHRGFVVSHTVWEANTVADYLSKIALEGNFNYDYGDTLPLELCGILMADCRGDH